MEDTRETETRPAAARPRPKRRGFRAKEVLSIYIRDSGLCAICGSPVEIADTSIDHRVPLARGGQHESDNWQLAHLRCNTRKGARMNGEQPSRKTPRRRGTVSVPSWLPPHADELSYGAMILYGLLRQYDGQPVLLGTLAKRLSCAERSARRLLSELERVGLMQIARVGRMNRYTLTDHVWMAAR